MSRTYLVTGGAGFLGAALVRRLAAAGHRVRVLDDLSRGARARLDGLTGACEVIEADVRDAAAVRRAAEGVDSLCHLAFVNGTEFFYTKPELVLDVGVRGMLSVLEACRAARVPELLLVSSSEVYQTPPVVPTDETVPLTIPDPRNPRYSYAAGKILSEVMALTAGGEALQRVLVVRPHNVYGPAMGWEHVIPQFALRMRALRDEPVDPVPFPIQGTGAETRAFVHLDDFTEGVLRVLTRGVHRAIYHIGTMEEQPIGAVAEAVARCFNRRIRLVPGQAAPGGTPRRCPDITKLRALGFAPRVPFEHGLAETVAWYDAHADDCPATGETPWTLSSR